MRRLRRLGIMDAAVSCLEGVAVPRVIHRRHCLAALAAGMLPGLAWRPAYADENAQALLRRGGVVLAMRHALAPGTFDPPGFRLGDCSTQRNLDEAGRAQARAIGQRLQAAGLVPARVRSSPWCRCMDTAQLAFGRAEAWAALGSPRAGTEATNAASLAQLRQALQAAVRQADRFEVWVTHMFVLADLVGANTASGEGLVLDVDSRGQPRVLARLAG
jgi:phosphohistidine phosphatase SixA